MATLVSLIVVSYRRVTVAIILTNLARLHREEREIMCIILLLLVWVK